MKSETLMKSELQERTRASDPEVLTGLAERVTFALLCSKFHSKAHF
jgi:hypothetical protein